MAEDQQVVGAGGATPKSETLSMGDSAPHGFRGLAID